MSRCKQCGSFAINPSAHGRADGVDLDLCDVCYWRASAATAAGTSPRAWRPAMHTESAVRALHEQQRQHREDVIHAASIRAMLCAARGLSESQACHPPGCPQHVDATLAALVVRGKCDDTEGGCCD